VSAPHALKALGYWDEYRERALRLLDAVEAEIDLSEGPAVTG
jgi:hypothetical protein